MKIIIADNSYDPYITALMVGEFSKNHNYSLKREMITINGSLVNNIFMAIIDDKPVGFCRIWVNRYHPLTLYFLIVVEDAYRRKGVGKALYDYIVNLNSDYRYLQCSLYESLVGTRFLQSLGFTCFRNTYEGEMDVEAYTFDYQTNEFIYDLHKLECVTMLEASSKIVNEFIILSKACYKKAHIDNPFVEISNVEWSEIVINEMDKEGSVLLLEEGRVVGYSTIYEGDELCMETGWRGIANHLSPYKDQLVKQMIEVQIHYALSKGVKYLYFEIDSTDSWSYSILDYVDLDKRTVWKSFQQRIDTKK